MKKTIGFLGILFFLGIVVYVRFFSDSSMISPLSSLPKPTNSTPTMTPIIQSTSSSLFVPYWSFINKKINTSGFDTVIYFGISADKNGIDTSDLGYKKISQFNKLIPVNTHTLLTVRMINSEINSKVLEDKEIQEKIIQESIALVQKYHFSGIVFDFEINALAFDSVIKNINIFYTSFSRQVRQNNLSFAVTIYGDTFYRVRPYDLATIAKNADQLYIMTYDFHKARGNPGPNFPLFGKATYGYDLPTMIDDFSQKTSLEKVVIVFGLFGYDWIVDDKNQSIATGVPLSYAEINTKYLEKCLGKNCTIQHESTSLESHIVYTDTDGKKHMIWFEDPKSIEKKKAFLSTKGINATGIWAYSYY